MTGEREKVLCAIELRSRQNHFVLIPQLLILHQGTKVLGNLLCHFVSIQCEEQDE